jgi:hypothetical protein
MIDIAVEVLIGVKLLDLMVWLILQGLILVCSLQLIHPDKDLRSNLIKVMLLHSFLLINRIHILIKHNQHRVNLDNHRVNLDNLLLDFNNMDNLQLDINNMDNLWLDKILNNSNNSNQILHKIKDLINQQVTGAINSHLKVIHLNNNRHNDQGSRIIKSIDN